VACGTHHLVGVENFFIFELSVRSLAFSNQERKFMPRDFFDGFLWHSAIGIDSSVDGNRKFVTRMANTPKARAMFIASGENMLIHRTTRALWKLSDDKRSIEPVFDTDVLGEDEVRQAMSEE